MAVAIRMKMMGRKHRAFFRICACDKRAPRDGKVLEELGTYDPQVPHTDARALLNRDRIDYWLSVGAQPTEKVAVLIKKYGTGGTHLAQQEKALVEINGPKVIPPAPKPVERPAAPAPAPEAAAPEGEAPVADAAE